MLLTNACFCDLTPFEQSVRHLSLSLCVLLVKGCFLVVLVNAAAHSDNLDNSSLGGKLCCVSLWRSWKNIQHLQKELDFIHECNILISTIFL